MTDLLAECSVRVRSRILFAVYLGQLEACAPISGFGAFSLLRLRLARVTSVHDPYFDFLHQFTGNASWISPTG
jgi:hypothetical protein